MSLDQLKQNVRGQIPSSGNLLQRAIETGKTANTFVTNDLPAIGGRILNTATAGGSDFLMNKAQEGLTSAGFPPQQDLIPKAQTGLGKVLEPIGSAAGFFAGPVKAIGALTKRILPKAAEKSLIVRSGQRAVEGGLTGAAIPGDVEQRKTLAGTGAVLGPIVGGGIEGTRKAFGAFRTGPTKQKLGNLATEAEDVAFRGADSIKKAIIEKLSVGRKTFGRVFSKITSKMKRSDFVNSLENSIEDLSEEGAEQLVEIPGSDAAILRKWAKKLAPQKKEN